MGIITGALGHIAKDAAGIGPANDDIQCIRQWTANLNGELGEMVCSSTQGGRLRTPSNRDWTGSWNGYGSVPPAMPGEIFWFGGAIEGGDAADASGVAGKIIIDSVEITFDIEGGTPISYVCNFGGIGPLTIDNNLTVPTDAGPPKPEPGQLAKLSIGTVAGAGFTDVPNVRTITLTFSTDNQLTHVSGTAPWPTRARGNLDVTLAATVYAEDVDGWKDFPGPHKYDAGQTYETGPNIVRVYNAAATFWEIKWMYFNTLTDMTVDIETSALVGASLGAQLTGWAKPAADYVLGHVKYPDTTVYWPF